MKEGGTSCSSRSADLEGEAAHQSCTVQLEKTLARSLCSRLLLIKGLLIAIMRHACRVTAKSPSLCVCHRDCHGDYRQLVARMLRKGGESSNCTSTYATRLDYKTLV